MEARGLVQGEPRGALARAVVGGLVAAIVGGVIWGLMVKWSDYEVGIVAWAIGFVVGTAVVLASGGARGIRLQIVAVVCALVGILVGKYLSFVWGVNEAADAEGVPLELPVLSGDTFSAFRESTDIVWSWFDLLWIGLAVYTAFRIPRPEEETAQAEPAAADGPRE